ncbi:tRNA (adenosine(37)-N6)-threonylcarbamoyltransferase complex dimerization subunit type 1 TsaB [Chloroflexota bacterium]
MKILGLDTSGYANALGVCENGRVLAEGHFPSANDSVQKIMNHITVVLGQADVSISDIDGFGVGLGPGSWTGIRVGVTVGKILAFSLGKPAAGVPSLMAVAYPHLSPGQRVGAVIGGGTGSMAYAAVYSAEAGLPVLQGDYYMGDVMELAGVLADVETVVTAVDVLPPDVTAVLRNNGRTLLVENEAPGGGTVALMAETFIAGGQTDDTMALVPLYLKEHTARAFQARYFPQNLESLKDKK